METVAAISLRTSSRKRVRRRWIATLVALGEGRIVAEVGRENFQSNRAVEVFLPGLIGEAHTAASFRAHMGS